MSSQLRQAVPHYLHHRVREPAGGGVRRQLQEGVRHHLQVQGHQHVQTNLTLVEYKINSLFAVKQVGDPNFKVLTPPT